MEQPDDDFIFVTYTSAPMQASRNPATRNIIRKQALKAHYSSQGSDLSKQRQRGSNATSQQPRKKHMSRFRLPKTPASHPRYAVAPIIPQQIHAFEPVVSSLGSDAWQLLDYLHYTFRMKSVSIHDNREWFMFAMYQTSISQATLSLVSLNRDLEQGKAVSTVTLQHRDAAMAQLKDEIAAGTTTGVGTVALLAISEDLEGNQIASRIHMEGMVKLLGVHECHRAVQRDRALLKIVAWADLCHAATWLSRPRPSALVGGEMSDRSNSAYAVAGSRLSAPAFRAELEVVLCPHLRRLIDILQRFPEMALVKEGGSEAERNELSNWLYTIEQLMLKLRRRIPYEGRMKALARAFVIAAQLYMTVVLKNVPKGSHMVLALANDLNLELKTYQIQGRIEEGQSVWNVVVLWIQVVLSLAVDDHDCASQLRVKMESSLDALGVDYLDQLKQQLHSIAWRRNATEDTPLQQLVDRRNAPLS